MIEILIALVICFAIVVAVISTSPEGWEDADGWHRGRKS